MSCSMYMESHISALEVTVPMTDIERLIITTSQIPYMHAYQPIYSYIAI